MKRFIMGILAAGMLVLNIIVPAAAVPAFSDIGGHWAESEITGWAEAGVLQGYAGLFRPDETITRAELSAVINRIMGLDELASERVNDVFERDWYYFDILCLIEADVLQGFEGYIRPRDPILREEAAAVFSRAFDIEPDEQAALEFDDSEDISGWAAGFVGGMKASGLIQGYENNFNPKANITRAEIIKILDNYFDEGLPAPSAEIFDEVQVRSAIQNDIESFLTEGYGEYYDVSGINCVFRDFDYKNRRFESVIFVSSTNKLKASSPDELPMVKGMLDAANIELQDTEDIYGGILANNGGIGAAELEAAARQISGTIEDVNESLSGENTFNFTFHYSGFAGNERFVNTTLSFMTATDSKIDANSILPQTYDSLYAIGYDTFWDTVETAAQSAPKAVAGYDRFVSRDYTDTFTSNPAGCSSHPSGCPDGILQDVSKYNPAYPWYRHNDCMNFISQAINAGGIPTDSTWQVHQIAWAGCTSFHRYISGKGYTYPSSYHWANIGSLAMLRDASGTEYDHIQMIAYNDTVTRLYNSHTNDRHRYVFAGGSRWDYYQIPSA